MLFAPAARALVSLMGLLVLAAALTATGQPARTGQATQARALRQEVLVALNAVRVGHGLAPLRLSRQLDAAAGAHSDQMLTDGYFAHRSADGSSYWRRIEGFYPILPGEGWAVGENLLWSPGSLSGSRAVALWMTSPEHRENILSPLWRQVGIGIRVGSSAPGVFEHLPVIVLTADFGVRS